VAQKQGKGCLFRRGKVWWIKISANGEAVRESAGSTKRADAVELLRKRLAELGTGTLPAWMRSSTTMARILELVPRDLKTYQKRDIKNVERQIRIHLGPFFNDLPVKRLSTAKVQEYIDARLAAGAAAATVNRELSTLRRGLHLALEQDPPLVGRFHKIRMLPEDNIRQGFLTEQQYLNLRKELPEHMQLALVIGYHVGIRRGELMSLTWDQVDIEGRMIALRGSQTKTGHARVLPIYGEMETWLRLAKMNRDLRCPQSDPVIQINCGGVERYDKSWKSACKRAGLDGLLFHDLRRTAVRNLLDAGIDEKTVMLITGHRTRTMIDRYNIRGQKDVLEAGRKLHAIAEQRAAEKRLAEGLPPSKRSQ
jgi:integrase